MGANSIKINNKQTKINALREQKEYKSFYLTKSTIELVNRVTLTKKLQISKYSKEDAVKEAFELLAKRNGIL